MVRKRPSSARSDGAATTPPRIPFRISLSMPATFGVRPVARRRPASTFSMLIRAGVALIITLPPASAPAGSALPEGFVYLRDIDPTIVQDIRYAGSHNFVGRPIRGYLAAECILSEPAANALEAVQNRLAEKKLSLIVWDCYRPKRAVDDFLQWSKDPAHSEMKTEFYPRRSARVPSRSASSAPYQGHLPRAR